MAICPDENSSAVDQSSFWDSDGLHWNTHRIGWAIAGGCTALTVIITFISTLRHMRSYTKPAEQRQIIRILYLPAVYAIISFLSYRFFRDYVYYSFIEVAYEALTLSAFLLLIIEYVAATASGHNADGALERKDKRALPLPFCCWRYRPTKAYFMYTVKWAVMQYVIVRPLISIAGIVCQKYNVLCETQGFDPHFASVYLSAVDFASISVALYGLLVFYGLTKEELAAKRPLAKFLSIKLIVAFTFYQSFVFKALQGKYIKDDSPYWTPTNVANGLNALAICIEMVFFALLMLWAYPTSEYRVKPGHPAGSMWRALWDSINYTDYLLEIWTSLIFFVDYMRGKPTAHGHGHRVPVDFHGRQKKDFGEAFRVDRVRMNTYGGSGYDNDTSESNYNHSSRNSYDEDVRLAPYVNERQ